MTPLSARTVEVARAWRETMLQLARDLAQIPDLPAALAEGARGLIELHSVLEAASLLAQETDAFLALQQREHTLALALLTAVAAWNDAETVSAVLGEVARQGDRSNARGADISRATLPDLGIPRERVGAAEVVPFPDSTVKRSAD